MLDKGHVYMDSHNFDQYLNFYDFTHLFTELNQYYEKCMESNPIIEEEEVEYTKDEEYIIIEGKHTKQAEYTKDEEYILIEGKQKCVSS